MERHINVQNKGIKFFKLFITSQLLEIVINAMYIVSFIVLCVEYTSIGNNNYTNHQIHDIIHNYFAVPQFNAIRTVDQFVAYFDTLVRKLYTFDSSSPLPFVVPCDALRLAKYAEPSCQGDTVCENDFLCTVTALKALYDQYSRCGKPYKGPTLNRNSTDTNFKLFTSRLRGEYSSYDLLDDGVQQDVTIDEWTTRKDMYVNMLSDKNMKCVVIMSNLYIPANGNYAHVVLGIEMLNYFTNVVPLFTVNVYSRLTSDDTVFLVFFVFFSVSSILNAVKFLYESNIKCICSVHTFMFYNELLNILLIVFTAFLMNINERSSASTSNPSKHNSYLALICIRKWIYVVLAMTIVCVPFRCISILSWCKPVSKHIVHMMRIFLRMLPGLAVCVFIMSLIFLMFVLTNFALYNEVLEEYKDMYSSFLSLFTPKTLHTLLHKSKIYHSLSHSSYYIVFNLYQTAVIMLLFGLLTGTMSFLFRSANAAEAKRISKKEGNNDVYDEAEAEVLEKIRQIEEKVVQSRTAGDAKAGEALLKQTVWLNLSNSNDVYNTYGQKENAVLFKNTKQVLAFLRCYFGIRPELRFNDVTDKIAVVVEIKNDCNCLNEFELEQIELLVDWVLFVGCKLPILVYTQFNLKKEFKMKMQREYEFISFISEAAKIDPFIRSEPPAYVCCFNASFGYEYLNGEVVSND